MIKEILDHFQVGKEGSGALRFCGREVTQLDDSSVEVIVQHREDQSSFLRQHEEVDL